MFNIPHFMSGGQLDWVFIRAGSGKSVRSLDSGHKLHLDLTKGCFIVKREKSVFSNIFDFGKDKEHLANVWTRQINSGLKYVKSLFGIPTADPVEDEASESLNPLEQLPDLFPHRHRPVSLLSLSAKTGSAPHTILQVNRNNNMLLCSTSWPFK